MALLDVKIGAKSGGKAARKIWRYFAEKELQAIGYQ